MACKVAIGVRSIKLVEVLEMKENILSITKRSCKTAIMMVKIEMGFIYVYKRNLPAGSFLRGIFPQMMQISHGGSVNLPLPACRRFCMKNLWEPYFSLHFEYLDDVIGFFSVVGHLTNNG
jgi:hypothetical protein